MTPVDAIREPDACPKCFERMGLDNPGGENIKKRFPKHLKAICWAYLCDGCAAIVAAAALRATGQGGTGGVDAQV
jgi:hypothetical protein